MSLDQSTRLESLIDRLRRGDGAARGELIACAYDRLRLLARHIFHHDFARLENLHGTDSIVNEAVLRLLQTSAGGAPWPTPLDFFRHSAVIIRRTLLDLIRYHDRRRHEAAQADAEPADPSADPATVAMWTEFHTKVDELPEEERAVVELHWYHELSQAETARLLGVHEKAVSRRWLSARLKLADWIPGWERLLDRQG
ncbi:MAG TPA: sigma-70 family RNA polymerase sigma factor [Gemmataceae bacterium]|nr:sigma-70 family RNA polymerase sigma factor [Gemmataceae bacterium]